MQLAATYDQLTPYLQCVDFQILHGYSMFQGLNFMHGATKPVVAVSTPD